MAQAADDDDTAKRTVMTVNAFGKATLNDGHPRIFVAKGSHGLYLASGSFAVAYPNESHPNFCGGFEGIPPPPVQPETHLADNPLAAEGLLWAKIVAGGGLLGPWGAAAGLVWGIVEYAEANHGLNVVGTGPPADNRAPDVAGGPGTGKTVQPAGLTGSDAGGDVQNWTSAQGLTIAGRRYDFIVNAARSPGGPATSIRAAIWAAGDRASNRSLRPARRHALPGLLAPFLPGVCQRKASGAL